MKPYKVGAGRLFPFGITADEQGTNFSIRRRFLWRKPGIFREMAHQLGMAAILWCHLRNSPFKVGGLGYHCKEIRVA